MEVSLLEILEARERRAARQQAMLLGGGAALICFTMNIAGPAKNSPAIGLGFSLGLRQLDDQLDAAGIRVLRREEYREHTGNEALLLVDREPLAVKALTVELEDGSALGRLFDMDVLRPDGTKVERRELGLSGRTCLLCGGPAQVCARSRAHSVEQLQEVTGAILSAAIREEDCRTAARLATQALLYEVAVTPKPGLVDRRNSGSHRDMDCFTFQASAAALWPYFAQCARIGMETREAPPAETFRALRPAGRLAEGSMRRATGGINTHKGAIFSLGLLCGALGRLDRRDRHVPRRVLAECAAMTEGLVRREFGALTPETARTAGERLYLRYGITGVRGQAEAGFPAVGEIGLPKLEETLAQGLSMNDAGCAALLAMLAATDDTNMLHRGGYDAQQRIRRELTELLRREPFPTRETLEALDDAFIRENLSPGGTADLLAMVYLLHFWREEPELSE